MLPGKPDKGFRGSQGLEEVFKVWETDTEEDRKKRELGRKIPAGEMA